MVTEICQSLTIYLPIHMHHVWVAHPWIENNHMHTGQFLTPDSPFQTTCLLTINVKTEFIFHLNILFES